MLVFLFISLAYFDYVHYLFYTSNWRFFLLLPFCIYAYARVHLREMLSLHAEGARKRATLQAEQQWHRRENRARRCWPLLEGGGGQPNGDKSNNKTDAMDSSRRRSSPRNASGSPKYASNEEEKSVISKALEAFDDFALGDPHLAEVTRVFVPAVVSTRLFVVLSSLLSIRYVYQKAERAMRNRAAVRCINLKQSF